MSDFRIIPREVKAIAEDVVFSMPGATQEDKLAAMKRLRANSKRKSIISNDSWDEDALEQALATF